MVTALNGTSIVKQGAKNTFRTLVRTLIGHYQDLVRTLFQGPKRTHKAKNSCEQQQRIFWTIRGVTGHYPVKQGFWGKSQQKVHPNVRQNLCHTVSLWYLFCPQLLWETVRRQSNRICVVEGGWDWGEEGRNCPKMLVFLVNSRTKEMWNLRILVSEMCCHLSGSIRNYAKEFSEKYVRSNLLSGGKLFRIISFFGLIFCPLFSRTGFWNWQTQLSRTQCLMNLKVTYCQVQILAVWIFGREAPKFWFEFCCGFLGGFFSCFSKEKGPPKSTKKSSAKFTRKSGRINSPRISLVLTYCIYLLPGTKSLARTSNKMKITLEMSILICARSKVDSKDLKE